MNNQININSRRMPCFYFPTTILWVDDDPAFLSNAQIKLSDNFPMITMSDPKAAIEKIANQPDITEFLGNLILKIDEEDLIPSLDAEAISIDWNAINEIIYKDKRFSNISTVLVDYNMPSINGIEFCRRIKDSNIKKIMVTGVADHELAVKAFNEGIIDKFVVKDHGNFNNELITALQETQREFFAKLSDVIWLNFCSHPIANSAEYEEVFFKFLKDFKIVEYYMADHYGSYLCLDECGQLYWFILAPEKKLEEYLDVAIGNHAAEEIVRKIGAKTHIPFLYSDIDKKLSVKEWNNYLFPVQGVINFKQNHYYTIIKDREFRVQRDKVKAFERYVQECA